MKNKIIIFCPNNSETGGVECLHQLCDVLRLNNIDAYMYYFKKSSIDLVPDQYRKYNIDVVENFKDDYSQIVIIPEIFCEHMFLFKKSSVFIWWLSIDNYFKYCFSKMSLFSKQKHILKSLKNLSINYRFDFNNLKSDVFHICQSHYAKEFLNKNSVNNDKMYILNDYINDIYTNAKISKKDKKNIVLFNPKKGYNYTKQVIEANSNIKFIPLINYSKNELYDLFKSAKVYIDFGNHPGRDKIPREACSLDCIIFVGKSGSASNDFDVPIDSKFKIDFSNFDPKAIGNNIVDAFENYQTLINNFSSYKKIVLDGKKIFTKQALSIFR